MKTQEKIINYVSELTRGVVNLNKQQAQEIIDLCSGEMQGAVVFYRFDGNNNNWAAMKTISVPDEIIYDTIDKNRIRMKEPFEMDRRFYKFTCTDSSGVCKGDIFTSDNNLF